MKHGNYTCEHCGAKVAIANFCPFCGREHSEDWKNKSKNEQGITGFASLIAMIYFLVCLPSLNLPLKQFLDQLMVTGFRAMLIGVAIIIITTIFSHTKSKKTEQIRKEPTL